VPVPPLISPRILNRIDDVVIFHRLSKEEIARIVELQVDQLVARDPGARDRGRAIPCAWSHTMSASLGEPQGSGAP
jgi:ATP-dependent Clp protease ATP-binding subunit ClpA